MFLDASVSFFVHLETQIYDSAEGHLGNEQQMIALSDCLAGFGQSRLTSRKALAPTDR